MSCTLNPTTTPHYTRALSIHTLHTVRSLLLSTILYSLLPTPYYSLRFPMIPYSLLLPTPYSLDCPRLTTNTTLYTLYILHYALHYQLSTFYTTRYTTCYTLRHTTLYALHYSLHSLRFTLHATLCATLLSMHYTTLYTLHYTHSYTCVCCGVCVRISWRAEKMRVGSLMRCSKRVPSMGPSVSASARWTVCPLMNTSKCTNRSKPSSHSSEVWHDMT